MAKAVLIQPSFYEAMKILPDEERLLLYDCICEYSLNGIEPAKLPPIVNSLFILMKPNIDSSNNRYSASVENGKKGGAPKGNQNAKKQSRNNQSEQPKNNHDLDCDFDSDLKYDCDNSADKPPHFTRFTPPDANEVREYCSKQGYASIDPERFICYYAARHWMAGKSAITDWRAAVDSWHRKDIENGKIGSEQVWPAIGTTV